MDNLLKGLVIGNKTLIHNNTSRAFLYRIILKHKKLIMLLTIFSILTSFIVVYPNELLKLSVNFAIDSEINTVIKYAFLYFILEILAGTINNTYNYISDYSRQKISNFAQMNSYKHILNLQYKEIEDFNSADILTREINSIDSISNLITQLSALIMGMFSGLWVFLLAFRIDSLLTFLVFILAEPLRLKLSKFTSRNIKIKVDEEQEYRSNVNKTILETFTSLREIKLFNMQKSQCEKLKIQHNGLFSKIKDLTLFRQKVSFLNDLIYNTVMFAVLLRGCILVVNKTIGPGDVMVLISYFKIYQMRVSLTFRMIANFQSSLVKINRSLEILLKKEEAIENNIEESIDININSPFSLHFKDVSFSYNGEKEILNNINLTLKDTRKIGIIGKSGAGKTTLIRLISMLYTNYAGNIKVNNVNIKDYSLKNIRNMTGVVPQDPIFFHDTIKNNILMGCTNVSQIELERVCKLVNAHEFIKEMPKNYETNIGEKGSKLSGGQKQRIALARCLIRNPQMVILDEPTSALDTLNKEKIIKELITILKDKSVIIISHEPEIMNIVDEIYILNNGILTQQNNKILS